MRKVLGLVLGRCRIDIRKTVAELGSPFESPAQRQRPTFVDLSLVHWFIASSEKCND